MNDTERRLPITSEKDIVVARQAARQWAQEMGFGTIDASRIATAVSELTRNVVRYATNGCGEVFIREVESPQKRRGLEIEVRDEGPGIEDVELVLKEGYTTGQGMGLGLPGTRRLMDETHIESALGKGTTVTVRKWKA